MDINIARQDHRGVVLGLSMFASLVMPGCVQREYQSITPSDLSSLEVGQNIELLGRPNMVGYYEFASGERPQGIAALLPTPILKRYVYEIEGVLFTAKGYIDPNITGVRGTMAMLPFGEATAAKKFLGRPVWIVLAVDEFLVGEIVASHRDNPPMQPTR